MALVDECSSKKRLQEMTQKKQEKLSDIDAILKKILTQIESRKDSIKEDHRKVVQQFHRDIVVLHQNQSEDSSEVEASLFSSSIMSEENPKVTLSVKEKSKQSSINSFDLKELKFIEQARQNSFSHWPSHSKFDVNLFINAGFFSCKVGDRVICIYCNIICQNWSSNDDDPKQVHEYLSPTCPFVLSMKKKVSDKSVTIPILNQETVTDPQSSKSNHRELFKYDQVVPATFIHQTFSNITTRSDTYRNLTETQREKLPKIDDLIRAGFFYVGNGSIVSCFYCGGSLQNWNPKDVPMIEHARWFPNCGYIRQLCGEVLYKKVQYSNKIYKDSKKTSDESLTNNLFTDQALLSKLIASRLDLEISQNMLKNGFTIAIIKRCFEDQLRLNKNDFANSTDLYLSCLILKKQIDIIQGDKNKIIKPAVAMKINQDSNEINLVELEKNLADEKSSRDRSINSTVKSKEKNESNEDDNENTCVLCLVEEKNLVFMPCGHLQSCIPCGYSLRSCPICRKTIIGYLRIKT